MKKTCRNKGEVGEKELKKTEFKTADANFQEKKRKDINEDFLNYKEKFLRLTADFQNFKSRVEKEKLELGWLFQAEIIEKLLPIFDDLNRALDLIEKVENESDKRWLEGFKLIHAKIQKVFESIDLVEIDCSRGFNPNYHEAIAQMEKTGKKTGEIIDVVEKGYIFKGKVLRHAKVVVAK